MHIVCINVGSKYPDVYVDRMYLMCRRYVRDLSRFTCFTDRPRNLNPEIDQRDCSSWGVTGWWTKLKLFDRAVLDEEFLFVDLDQIVLKSLDPLIEYSSSNPHLPIIGMLDFYYESFGSDVLLVRPSETTQGIWDAYASGEMFVAEGHSSGDQDFIEGYAKSRGIAQHLGMFPSEWFVSYKVLRKVATSDPSKVPETLASALFLVFHGRPKQHEVLQPARSLIYLLRHRPLRALQYWRFLDDQIRRWWCLEQEDQAHLE